MAKLQSSNREVSTNIGAGTAFGMVLTAKSYDIMISDLYEDPKRATVREMTTNMSDAHTLRDQYWHLKNASASAMPTPTQSVYANKLRKEQIDDPELNERLTHLAPPDKVYEVQLPSSIDPNMIFRDFGVGMHIDTILGPQIWAERDDPKRGIKAGDYLGRHGGVYTTLFNSTKDDTNDFVGALGLGSKTPFAMTTTFSFKSTYKGLTHHYIATKDEGGLPTCVCVSEIIDEDGTSLNPDGNDEGVEYDGLEVTVPIGQSDWEKMRWEAEDLFGVFRTPPVVTGNLHYSYTPIDRSVKFGNTYIVKKRHGSTYHYVIMGDVAYPVNVNKLSKRTITALSSLGATTYTELPIGAVDFQPSRDGLNYNDRTIVTLNRYYDAMTDGLCQSLLARVSPSRHKSIFSRWTEIMKIREEIGPVLFKSLRIPIYTKGDHSALFDADTKPTVDFPTQRFIERMTIPGIGGGDPIIKEKEYMAPMAMMLHHSLSHDDQVIGRVSKPQSSRVSNFSFDKLLRLQTWYDRDIQEDISPVSTMILFIKDTERQWRRRLQAVVDGHNVTSIAQLFPTDSDTFDEEAFLSAFPEHRHLFTIVRLSEWEPKPRARTLNDQGRSETPVIFELSYTYLEGKYGYWNPVLKDNWEDIVEGATYVNMKGCEVDAPMTYLKRHHTRGHKIYAVRRNGRRLIKQFDLQDNFKETIREDIKAYFELHEVVGSWFGFESVIEEWYDRVEGSYQHSSHSTPLVNPYPEPTGDQKDLFDTVVNIKNEDCRYYATILDLWSPNGLESPTREDLIPAVKEYVRVANSAKYGSRSVSLEEHTVEIDGKIVATYREARKDSRTSSNLNFDGMIATVYGLVDHISPTSTDVKLALEGLAVSGVVDYQHAPKWTSRRLDELWDNTLNRTDINIHMSHSWSVGIHSTLPPIVIKKVMCDDFIDEFGCHMTYEDTYGMNKRIKQTWDRQRDVHRRWTVLHRHSTYDRLWSNSRLRSVHIEPFDKDEVDCYFGFIGLYTNPVQYSVEDFINQWNDTESRLINADLINVAAMYGIDDVNAWAGEQVLPCNEDAAVAAA